MESALNKAVRGMRLSLRYLLDTIAPPDPLIRSIELMSPSEFANKAAQSEREDAIDGIHSLFSYKNPLAKACILEIKSYGSEKLADLLGKAAYDSLIPELSELETFKAFSEPLLVPIPLTKKSLRKRGWNQCELIGKAIERAGAGSLKFKKDILIKSKETGDQVGKSRTERFANLKGCFSVPDPTLVREKNIVVLDDIVTTGATLIEAKKALDRAGAKRTFLVAICH